MRKKSASALTAKEKRHTERIFEIDFLRGVAVLCMVYFHIIYDLVEFYGFDLSYDTGIHRGIGLFSAISFIAIAGVSTSLSENNLKRGFKILLLALLITGITHIIGKGTQILFGILHLLGISMMLGHFLTKLSSRAWMAVLLVFSGLVIFGSQWLPQEGWEDNWFMIFGLTTLDFYSADYYPLIPWLGVFVMGILAGQLLYPKKRSLLPSFRWLQKNPVNFLGRHALVIYLLHQPLLLLLFEGVKAGLPFVHTLMGQNHG